jgi:hypothetical protein
MGNAPIQAVVLRPQAVELSEEPVLLGRGATGPGAGDSDCAPSAARTSSARWSPKGSGVLVVRFGSHQTERFEPERLLDHAGDREERYPNQHVPPFHLREEVRERDRPEAEGE